jgi:SAM-dependent methyltransferase
LEIMVASKTYDHAFYEGQMDGSYDSAQIVVPLIFDAIMPTSVLDVGCGVGNWVAAFERAGCGVAHGMDGPWVKKEDLKVRPEQFTSFDFEAAQMPFAPKLPQSHYDLVCSFEVAEHIPDQLADSLVEFMTSIGNVVVLGAAIPLQGGTRHINEQWPSYWAAKFEARGYKSCDFLRPVLWQNRNVLPWYRQNTVGYFKGQVPEAVEARAISAWQEWAKSPRPLVAYDYWEARSAECLPTVENVRRIGDRLLRNSVKRLIGRT